MAEYINREDAIKATTGAKSLGNTAFSDKYYIATIIQALPAADVAPVRHGRWVTKKDACGRDHTICSVCETKIQWIDRRGVILSVDMQTAPYCPNCGARMDGDNDG